LELRYEAMANIIEIQIYQKRHGFFQETKETKETNLFMPYMSQ
jgi:hypothetical protein